MHMSSKAFVSDLVFSVSTRSNHHLVCNSVILFEPVPVNASRAVERLKT